MPSLNSGKVELLDKRGLERRTSRSGRDTIDHSPGGHDDVANAAAGALRGAGYWKGTIVLVSKPQAMM